MVSSEIFSMPFTSLVVECEVDRGPVVYRINGTFALPPPACGVGGFRNGSRVLHGYSSRGFGWTIGFFAEAVKTPFSPARQPSATFGLPSRSHKLPMMSSRDGYLS